MAYTWNDIQFNFNEKLTATKMQQLRDNLGAISQHTNSSLTFAFVQRGLYVGDGTSSRFITTSFDCLNSEIQILIPTEANTFISPAIYTKLNNLIHYRNTFYFFGLPVLLQTVYINSAYIFIDSGWITKGFVINSSFNISGKQYYYKVSDNLNHSGQFSDYNKTVENLSNKFLYGTNLISSDCQALRDNLFSFANQESGALGINIIKTGTYTGDGTQNRWIDIGVVPKELKIFKHKTMKYKIKELYYSLTIVPDSGSNLTNLFLWDLDSITSLGYGDSSVGFRINHVTTEYSGKVSLPYYSINKSGDIYNYIAWS